MLYYNDAWLKVARNDVGQNPMIPPNYLIPAQNYSQMPMQPLNSPPTINYIPDQNTLPFFAQQGQHQRENQYVNGSSYVQTPQYPPPLMNTYIGGQQRSVENIPSSQPAFNYG